MWTTPVNAQTQFTRAQLEQFSKLPRAQQEALAKQYGVDLSDLIGGQSTNTNTEQKQASEIEQQQQQVKAQVQTAKKQTDNAKQKTKLKPFGYSLFDGASKGFSNINNIPVPANYLVGPQDVVTIQLYGKESSSYELEVENTGDLTFPDYGPLNVSGLTFSELKQVVKAFISSKTIGISVSVRLSQLKSMQVFILGEAFRPGSYTLSSLSTITHALFASGGVNTNGSLRNIQLKRQGKLIASLDVYDLLLKGDTSSDVRLQSGDVVFVPTIKKRASIAGQVMRQQFMN